ncbi:putative membrane protein [Saonia flava]|uniref:Putative membrane protein n=1 Tax=Saonia flava TaxID=523696 RepID=A0A846QT53_9FLAO|nr:heme-binding domain-containing protein [Saonia flava]NJB70140.1 putative membrane protein [Saonia flava]
MTNKTKMLCALLSFILLACTNDSESDLLLEPETNSEQETEEPSGIITYNANIKSIIDGNCLGCHSNPPRNGAPFSLTTYEQVKTRADNGSLLSSLSKQTSENGSMPPANRLPQSTIDLIEQWIQDGTLEN